MEGECGVSTGKIACRMGVYYDKLPATRAEVLTKTLRRRSNNFPTLGEIAFASGVKVKYKKNIFS
jgi:hypothetical protein